MNHRLSIRLEATSSAMATYFEIICGIIALFFAFYFYFTSTFDFWKVRGVPGPKPVPVFGNIKDVMLLRTSMCAYLKKLWEEYKDEPMVGIFTRKTPILILQDPELIKDVLIRDFSIFADRGIPVHEKVNELTGKPWILSMPWHTASLNYLMAYRDLFTFVEYRTSFKNDHRRNHYLHISSIWSHRDGVH